MAKPQPVKSSTRSMHDIMKTAKPQTLVNKEIKGRRKGPGMVVATKVHNRSLPGPSTAGNGRAQKSEREEVKRSAERCWQPEQWPCATISRSWGEGRVNGHW